MKSKSPLFIIFLVVFIDLVGFGIVIPIMPYYAKTFGASASTLGWLMASYSLMQFIFSPIWGHLSDRVGRRPIILMSLFGGAIGFSILGFAGSTSNPLLWLFIGRIVSGISGGNISTAAAYIADVTTPENRAKGMGLIGASFGLGFIFGPAIGGLLYKFGFGVPMFAAAALCLLDFIFAFFKLSEPETHTEKARIKGRLKELLADPRAFTAVLCFFIATFAFTQVEVSFALYMLARFNFDAPHSGMMLAFMGIIGAIIQGGLIGKLSKKHGEVKLILIGTFLVSVGLSGMVSAHSLSMVVFLIALVAIGNGLNNPSLSSLASQGARPDQRGAVMGVYQSASAAARVLGPLVGGFAFDLYGDGAPYGIAALMYGVAFVIILKFFKTNPLKSYT